MENIDVHGVAKAHQASLDKLASSKDANTGTIEDFVQYCKAKGIGKKRVVKYVYTLLTISKMLDKLFNEATKQDIVKLMSEIQDSKWSEWTKHDYKVCVKRLYKWLEGNDEEYPEKVKWIKTTFKKSNSTLPEEILQEEEIFSLVKSCENLKHKAIILSLYESGARIEEFLTLTNKRLQFDENGCVAILSGKTGMRRLRLISSAPLLKTWLESHPLKDEDEFPLWVAKNRNKIVPMSYTACNMLLTRLADKAGIKKKVNPHAFRHARATHLSKILTHSQLCAFFGWSQNSEMPATYIHLSGSDIDNTLLASQGLKPIDNKSETLFIKVCPNCRDKNSPLSSICVSCGEPLTSQEKMKKKVEELERRLQVLEPYMRMTKETNTIADNITGSRLNQQLDDYIKNGKKPIS